MIYNGKELKKLGFGLMRLPMLDDEIDIEQTKQMVDVFMENGFTYFDTAYGYINQRSEVAAKIALIDRYPRESFQFATKLPAWSGAKTAEEAKNMFYTSLERTGAGYFDFYLLHNVGADRTSIFEEYDLWNFIIEQKKLGKIKKIGFSLHDTADRLEELLIKHPEVDFVQLQINYADWEHKTIQSRKNYEMAEKYGKPVIIMEPIRGGALATPPPQIKEIFDATNSDMSYAQWALRYAASLDNAMIVLSGMSTLEQMQENVSFMKEFEKLNEEEYAVIKKAQDVIGAIPTIPCTNCKYCIKDCPQGILISSMLAAMNKFRVFGDFNGAKRSYEFATKNNAHASECIACGACESVCPQSIKIIDELVKVSETLENA
ncbi:MAG: aldo/keto reductase [Clostridia bacterium]